MSHIFKLITFLLVIFSTGCVSPPLTVKTPVNTNDYVNYGKQGTGAIAGEAFGRTKGGDIKIAAGLRVFLDPVTPYSTEVYKTLSNSGDLRKQRAEDTVVFDPLMLKYRRTVIADSTGHFRFQNIPKGDYFVTCYISWLNVNFWTGGWHVKRVRIADGEVINGISL